MWQGNGELVRSWGADKIIDYKRRILKDESNMILLLMPWAKAVLLNANRC
jgi:hypothetical protein